MSKPWFFSLCNHSTTNIINIKQEFVGYWKRVYDARHISVLNNETMYCQASVMVSARNMIQPNITSKNVTIIIHISFTLGNNLLSATTLVYLRFLPKRISGKNSKA